MCAKVGIYVFIRLDINSSKIQNMPYSLRYIQCTKYLLQMYIENSVNSYMLYI